MEVHRQQCQACGKHDSRNIVMRAAGRPQTVFVRCANCGELVARYILSDYYHHGKDVESFLRSRESSAAESGRNMLSEFKRVREDSLEGFRKVIEILAEQDKAI